MQRQKDAHLNQDNAEPKSRTQKKREAQELQAWGEKLVLFSEEQLKKLDLPEKLHTAIQDAKIISRREAQRRQMQLIGKLIRKVDPEPIRDAIESSEIRHFRKVGEHKRIEDLRDGLINGKKDIQKDVLKDFPEADRRHLSQLIRNARKEAELNKPPKSSRVLFRYLRDLFTT